MPISKTVSVLATLKLLKFSGHVKQLFLHQGGSPGDPYTIPGAYVQPHLAEDQLGQPPDMAWAVSYWSGYFDSGLGILIHENAQAGHTVLVASLQLNRMRS